MVDFKELPHIVKDHAVYFVTASTIRRSELTEPSRRIVLDCILHWHETNYFLYAGVVMPDHFHVLFHPLPDQEGNFKPLPAIMRTLKGFSSWAVNKALGKKGALWQRGYFDRIMGSPREMEKTWEYVLNNPVTAGLARSWDEYPFLWTQGMITPHKKRGGLDSPPSNC